MVSVTEKINVIREPAMAWDTMERWIAELKTLIATGQEPHIIAHLQILVPEYNPPASGRRQPIEMVPVTRSSGLVSVS
jgi:hypothetical protein